MKRGKTTQVNDDLDLTPVSYDDGSADVEWSISYTATGEHARDRWRRYSQPHRTVKGFATEGRGAFSSAALARFVIRGFVASEARRDKP